MLQSKRKEKKQKQKHVLLQGFLCDTQTKKVQPIYEGYTNFFSINISDCRDTYLNQNGKILLSPSIDFFHALFSMFG